MALPQQLENASVTLTDLLSHRYAPVQEALRGMLDFRDEKRLKCVSKDTRSAVATFRDWNNILAQFLLDPKGFRSFQARINGILIGGVVLDFFARIKNFIHEDPLLNFLVEEDDMEGAIAFLVNDGFVKLDEHEEDAGYLGCNHLCVHPNRSTRAKKQVKVLLCGNFYSPINVFLSGNNQMSLHTTLDFNIATWNKAYSVFPSLTFLDDKGYVTGPITSQGEEVGGGR
jgi:hypothetical protein